MIDNKKVFGIAILAFLLAIIGFSVSQNAQITADNNANITNVFEVVVNNTNLAPTFADSIGTGERIEGTNYTANSYPLQILLWSHASSSGQTSEIHLYINGTKVGDTSGKPLGAAEEANKTIISIVPKNSIYKVEMNNYHHYQWREYPILSGRNGTLSLNQSIVNTTTNNYYNNTTAGLTNNSLLNSSTVNVTKNANGTVSFNTNISNMSIVTSSRTAGTVYRNNFNIPIYVSVSVTCSTTATILATIGNTSSPTSNIVLDDAVAATRYSGFFIVIPGYFYKVACNAGSTTIIQWTEWN